MEDFMKSEKRILAAFILNLAFSLIEFAGGLLTSSIAIASDALHDLGDAAGIGVSYFLEKKSRKHPDEKYTYGYIRYSVLGGAITSLVLLCGSLVVIVGAVERLIDPTLVNYDGMIIFAVLGVIINTGAALLTFRGSSINQRAVSLHMLEDVLGWIVVLIGAVVMRFSDLTIIDPIMSIFVAIFIASNASINLRGVIEILMDKTPRGIDLRELLMHLSEVDGVVEIHHLHVWSLDGQNHCATLHAVVDSDPQAVKNVLRQELLEHGIRHVTIETESENEFCAEKTCRNEIIVNHSHGHHHHG